MNIAYKYRIYPDRKQTLLIEKTFGCCRKVWNLMLSDKIAYYKSTGKSLMTTPAMYKKNILISKKPILWLWPTYRQTFRMLTKTSSETIRSLFPNTSQRNIARKAILQIW